jgi:hypothetical protein
MPPEPAPRRPETSLGPGVKTWMLPLIVAAAVVPPVLAFALVGSAVGIAVILAELAVIVFVAVRSVRNDPFEVAPPTGDGRTRRLVVLMRDLQPAEAARLRGSADEVRVTAPMTGSATRRWLSTTGPDRARAQQRLDEALQLLRQDGRKATGEVGDAEAVRAAQDALGGFPADAVTFVLSEPADASSAERVRRRVEAPVDTVPAPA